MVATPALAQKIAFPKKPKPPPKKQPVAGEPQMLVQADEIDYDNANHLVSAVGSVQIYYKGSRLQADRVIYNQDTKRLHAEGNAILTDQNGNVTHGSVMDLSDDYRDGFVDSLRLETADNTRMAAARADRSAGTYTVYQNGVYTACAPCKDDPKKPPLWQVKAVRIIHNTEEKVIYFEDATIEFFGKPIAWLPYFSAPDPTVQRMSGVLQPRFASSSLYGAALEVPYYWALAPDYDATIAPMITSRQGALMQGEFRQRLINGAYEIRAAGIDQMDKNVFAGAPGYRDWRGSLESSGIFALNNKWVWGWDAVMLSDKTFLQDYKPRLSAYRLNDVLQTVPSEGISQLYLIGRGDRSYFEARSIYYLGFSISDVQKQIPVIHPVIDYKYTFDQPVMGGELGFKVNFTSLSRQQANFDAITQAALTGGVGGESMCLTADPAVKMPMNCLLRGAPGVYSRFSAEATWRRTITDSLGQQWTPFLSLRADAGSMNINNDATGSVTNYLATGESSLARGMPTVGLEYRYPFINVQPWGTQTFEPIVQVIARPNETQIGRWPNEDSQSFVFDDSNLFRVDKFAGFDRIEGGGRVNYGAQYTMQFNHGGFINALFGQSYQLFGLNSFAVADPTNTGLDSGLDKARSDYVARVSYQPNSILTFTSRFRFDSETFDTKRLEVEGSARFDRWSLALLYGDYAAQPDIGFLTRRQGLLGSGTIKLDTNWLLLAAARYDFTAEKFDQTRVGLGYIDDCVILALNYTTNYTYSPTPVIDHQVALQLTLRTLGGNSVNPGTGFGGL